MTQHAHRPIDPSGAVFIGACAYPVSDEGDPAVYFRTEFDVTTGLVAATLRLTALGVVEPHLNGHRVGDEVLEPGWTSYTHRLTVRDHDVTTLLQEGRNAFGAIVGDGWAVGRLGYEAITRRRRYSDRVALFAVIELTYPDRIERIVSDERFRAGTGAVRANSIYDGDTIDYRLDPIGWAEPGFDDAAWGDTEAIDWDLSTLVAPIAPPIRRIEELAPVRIWTTDRDTTAVDFGQNISGWVRLRISGPEGHTVTLRHAEVLVDDVPDYLTLRTAKATDQYTLAGRGVEVLEPRFTFHGFRYAEIDGLPAALSADDIRAVVIHSDMERTGWFECSDPLVQRLHDNVVWSMRDNFVGVPTDCPQRDERLGWTGDLNAFAPTATFLYDVRDVLASWLADLRVEQEERGYVPYVVPDVQDSYDQPTALWSDAAVSIPWALYEAYGDVAILEASYDSMATFTRSVESRLDDRGLWSSGFQFGDWLDPDAPAHNPLDGKTQPHLVAAAYFAKVTDEMARTASLLDRTQDAEHFGQLAIRVRTAFRHEYVTENGRVTNESATAYALAIQFGLLDDDQLPVAGRRLSDIVRRANHRISTGFAGTPLVAHALSSTGHVDDAYRLLLETGMPSFLYPVTQGATTIWERWDSVLPDGTVNPSGMTSLNHYALGSIARWLHEVIAGLRATSPGYDTVRIAPRPGGGLTHASAALDTRHGRVAVAWRLDGSDMSVDVTIPAGVAAEVELPWHPTGDRLEVGSGEHRWSYAATLPDTSVTFSSPIGEVAADRRVWPTVTTVLRRELRHFPAELLMMLTPNVSFAEVIVNLPGMSDEVLDEIKAAFE